MRVAQLETAPLRVFQRAPAVLAVVDLDQVGPGDRLGGPAERLGHRLPHRHHDRREHQRLPRGAQRLGGLGLVRPGLVELGDVEARRGAEHGGLRASGDDGGGELTRAAGLELHHDRSAGLCLRLGRVEGVGLLLEPGLLLAAVGHHHLHGVGRDRLGRRGRRGARRLGAGSARGGCRGRLRVGAAASQEQHQRAPHRQHGSPPRSPPPVDPALHRASRYCTRPLRTIRPTPRCRALGMQREATFARVRPACGPKSSSSR